MKAISEEVKNQLWSTFCTEFERLGLSQHYDMNALYKELPESPCALTEDMGTAYKGALLSHILTTLAIAQRVAKMISGTFTTSEDSLSKVCLLMHLSKRHMFEENDADWAIKKGILFKYKNTSEGCLKSGERSALEALNNGVNITPIEFEAIKCLDDPETYYKNPFLSILTTIVKTANDLAYAIAKERYNKGL